MVKSLSLIFLLALTACSGFSTRKGVVDPLLLPYLEAYQLDKLRFHGTSVTSDMTLELADIIDQEAIGYCFYHMKPKLIQIDRSWFARATDADKKTLVYHELGHCDLNLSHSDEYRIMYMYGLRGERFIMNPEFYIQSLFLEGK